MNMTKQIDNFESEYGLIIPQQYKEFLETNDGVSFDGGLILYSLGELKQVNDDLQIQRYQYNYIAIGDDGGGLVFLMRQESSAEEVICVDMSDYDVESPFCRIKNFSEWYNDGCRICVEEQEDNNKLSQIGDIFLVKMPYNGTKDLIKIKQVLNMNVSTAQLLTLSKSLPCKLIGDIKYAKAIKLIEKVGQVDIFEFQEK